MAVSKEGKSNEGRNEKWLVWKDRLAIMAVVIILAALVLMMFMDSIMNFQCSAWQFITFECNRFDAKFKPWQ